MRDPYAVLGVKKSAGQEEIKAAWRSLAKAVHPDQNHDDPLATVRFTEAGRAYDLLRDPDKRSRYDRQQREAEICRALEAGPADADGIATRLYPELAPALHPAACRNVFAHLLDLLRKNRVTTDPQPRMDSLFHLR